MGKFKYLPAAAVLVCGIFLVSSVSFSHCEIPCGIYDDEMRIHLLEEHAQTIEKSMKQIEELSGSGEPNYNQLVRWINNKEAHADKFQEIVTQYFMTQRIKPVGTDDNKAYNKYIEMTTVLQQMLVYAMKCKQTTDLENVKKLRELIKDFEKLYF